MIIGTLVETTINGSTTRELNGASSIIFYTEFDAITWARLQSESWTIFGGGDQARCSTMVINTDTGVKRWWYDGTEQTG
jgi:hypothetical protein